MIYNANEYTYVNPYHQGKVGYINKMDKSLKMPFLKVLQNQVQMMKPAHADEPDVDDEEIQISDNIELSSAVVSMSNIGEQV